MKFIPALKIVVPFLSIGISLLQGATTYSIEYIQVPGAQTTIGSSVNNSGKVTGFYFAGNVPLERGFIWDSNNYTLIDYPGAGRTIPGGINDAGVVVGTAEFPGVTAIGFTYSGSYSPFAILGAQVFGASGINNAGTIVGSYTFAGETYGYSLSGGVYSLVSAPGVNYTNPVDLNDNGQILGNTYLPERGFLLQGGVYNTVLPPGYFGSRVAGINNLGQFVGSAKQTSSSAEEPLFFDGISYVPFSLPGIDFISLYDINDMGQILGTGITSSGATAFLATPIQDETPPEAVPEPSTALGGVMAFGLLLASARFQRRTVHRT